MRYSYRRDCRSYEGSRYCQLRHFGTLVRRVCTLLMAAPVWALPPGVLYSTTVPYTLPPGVIPTDGYGPFPPLVNALTTDAAGNSYVAGSVYVTGFAATPGVIQTGNAGGTCYQMVGPSTPCPDAFVAKFDSQGTLLFLTYLGGTGSDTPGFISVDPEGNIYIGGQTTSSDFPLVGTPWRPALSGPASFLAKLSGDGTRLIWSTLVNGTMWQMAVDQDGSVYSATSRTNTGSEGTDFLNNMYMLRTNGQWLLTVALPQGTNALAVSPAGTAFIGGVTDGSDVTPTPGAWQTTFSGGATGFVARLNPSLSGYLWLTFANGGADGYDLTAFAVAPDLSVWLANYSQLLVHLSAAGSKALSSSYLPAPARALALDASGDVIFSASDEGTLPPVPGAPWPCLQLSVPLGVSYQISFYGKMDPGGQNLLWGTWTGSAVPGGAVAVDPSNNVIAAATDGPGGDLVLSAMVTRLGPPRLVASCVVPSAYPSLPGPLAPGEIISIYGAGFGPEQGVAALVSADSIGTELAGVRVLLEGTPAPLLYLSATQINLVTPFALKGLTSAHVKIVTATAASNEVVLNVQPAAPEIFASQISEATATAAIINQDGTVNSPAHPAHTGDAVAMYVSGVGQTNPPGVDGAIPTAAGGTPLLPITVQLISAPPPVSILYAGNAPGLVSGAVQINFQIPEFNKIGLGPPYQVWIQLSVGTATSSNWAPVIWCE